MTPIWLAVAEAFLGLREIAGPQSSPVILRWVKQLHVPAWYDDDSKPWCALFLNRVLAACHLPMSGTGYDLLRAKSFETWGRALTAPALGAVLVFTRDGGGHVGFYLGENAHAYKVLGGNQGNTVSETWIAKDRCSAIRWPDAVPLPLGGPVMLAANGEPVSGNEA